MAETSNAPIVNLVSPPPSGEAPIQFESLVESAFQALPESMPTDPKKILIGLDLDGTVLLPTGASARVRAAIGAAEDAGMNVVIATGRSLEATQPVLEQLGDPRAWALCSNGAIRVHFSDAYVSGALSADISTFDPSTLVDQVGQGMPNALIGVEIPGMFLISGLFPPGELIEEFSVKPVEDLKVADAIKVVIREPAMNREEFETALTNAGVIGNWECSIGWTSWADVLPLGVTKASGLETLSADLGVPFEGTVAIGDGTNDVPMIEWANFGVVMGGADDNVKKSGDFVTGAVENDGAAAIICALLRHCGQTITDI